MVVGGEGILEGDDMGLKKRGRKKKRRGNWNSPFVSGEGIREFGIFFS